MISVTLLVKNGERRLKEVLSVLKPFDEVIVLDTGSTDASCDIASQFPYVTLHKTSFNGFGPAHNLAASFAKNAWILSIDADEVLSDGLIKEILTLKLNPNNVYSFPFHNYFNGKWIRWCGWYPESHVRLYNKTVTQFSNALVHEGVITEGLTIQSLSFPVLHYPYDSLSDFLMKMERYSSLFAAQYANKRRSSPLIALYHGCGAFLKSFILKTGFLGGYEGFVISMYNGHTAFYKYLKLYQTNAAHISLPSDRNR